MLRARGWPAASILALLLVVSACGGGGESSGSEADTSEAANPVVPGAREIAVVGNALRFSPDDIVVRAGEDFTIALNSRDIRHTFVIEGVEGEVAAGAGQTRRGGYQVDTSGRYTFFCSVPGHRSAGMEGTLDVTS